MAIENNELATIKKPNDVEYITKEEYQRRVQEIAKCKRSIQYFAEKYFKIINLDQGLTTIKLYPKQKELLQFLCDEDRGVILAARQSSKCVDFLTKIQIRNRKFPIFKLSLPIGIVYIFNKILSFFKQKETNEKFVDIIQVNGWQVKSENSWNDICSINKTIKYDEYVIESDTGRKMYCADNHILIGDDHSELFAKDSLGKNIITEIGVEKIIRVYNTRKNKNMYDLSLSNTSDHLYYSNGFLSHNTTTYTIFALWYTMFFPDKKIMVLCNKASVMSEVIGRIQLAYQYLPKFLKSAVSVWNKTEIIFSNHSAIKGFPASSDSARGFSANCVLGNSIIWIRFKWLKFIKIPIPIYLLRMLGKQYYDDKK